MEEKRAETREKKNIHPCAEECREEIKSREIFTLSAQKAICKPIEGQRNRHCHQRIQQAAKDKMSFRRKGKGREKFAFFGSEIRGVQIEQPEREEQRQPQFKEREDIGHSEIQERLLIFVEVGKTDSGKELRCEQEKQQTRETEEAHKDLFTLLPIKAQALSIHEHHPIAMQYRSPGRCRRECGWRTG